ncbi:MAG TPA: ABC transporter permease [Polyangiaceae bacterium]|nr:ABC transporter permease [Polyangiaceae bacterium]
MTAQASPPAAGLVSSLGATSIELFVGGRDLYSVFVRVLVGVARRRWERRAVVEQMFEIGNRSMFFVSITLGFLGMILVYQSGLQIRRVVPDFTMLGATYLQLLVRDIAASLGGLMLATRVGAGIAAEIGSMVVTEQVDALRMCAADPVDFLVVPRFLASIVMSGALVVWAGLVAFSTGALTAHFAFDVSLRTFCNVSLVSWSDVVTGMSKSVAYGAAIPIVSGHCGLSTFGGSEGVGWATTRAVVNSSLAIIILNALISTAALLAFGAK